MYIVLSSQHVFSCSAILNEKDLVMQVLNSLRNDYKEVLVVVYLKSFFILVEKFHHLPVDYEDLKLTIMTLLAHEL